MDLLRKIFRRIVAIPIVAKFVKFGVVGASGAVVDYGVLIICRNLICIPEAFDWLSIAIAFIIAASSNYVLNRIWTFHSHNKRVGREYVNFIIVSIVGLLLTEVTMYVLRETRWTQLLLGFELSTPMKTADAYFYINKLIAIVVTMLWNFFGNLFITFRQRKDDDGSPAGAEGGKAAADVASSSSSRESGSVAVADSPSAESHDETTEDSRR